MKLIKYTTALLMLFTIPKIHTINSIITLSIQKYPTIKMPLDQKEIDTYSKKLQQPGYLYKKILQNHHSDGGVHGIMGFYLGHVALSDHNGYMTFPRKQQSSNINFLVTKGIKPVYMIAPSTLANWMIDASHPAQMYTFTFKQDNKTKLYYFQASKTDLPEKNMIPLDTIILIADPKNVVIPDGATVSYYSPNLILPTIYIKKNFNFSYNALYTTTIKQYFDRVHKQYKQEEQSVLKTIH